MFLGFANFYKQFIKGFSKIVARLTSILKTTAPSTLARAAYTKAEENELGTDGGGGISGGRIDDRLANLSSSTKKMSSGSSFFTFEASLAFT